MIYYLSLLLLLGSFSSQSVSFINNIQKNVIMPPTSVENAQKSLIFLQGMEAYSESNKKTLEDYTNALTDYIKFKNNSEAWIKKCKDNNSDPVPVIKGLYANLLERHALLDFGDPVYNSNLSLYVTMPPTNLENAQESLVLLEGLKIGSFTETSFKDKYNKYLNAIKDYIKFEEDSKLLRTTGPEVKIQEWHKQLLEKHPILSPKDHLPVIKNGNDLSLYVTMPPTNLENARESLKFLQGMEPNTESNKKTRKDYIEALTDYIQFEQGSELLRTTEPEVIIQEWHKQLLEIHPILLLPKYFDEYEKNETNRILVIVDAISHSKYRYSQLISSMISRIDFFLSKYLFNNTFYEYKELLEDAKSKLIGLSRQVENNKENIFNKIIFEFKYPSINFSVEKNTVIKNLPFDLRLKKFKINNKYFPLILDEKVEDLYEEAKRLLSIEDEYINVEVVSRDYVRSTDYLPEFKEFKRIKDIFTKIFEIDLNNSDEIKKTVLELRELYYIYQNNDFLKSDFEKYYKAFLTLLKNPSNGIPQNLFSNTDFKNVPISSNTKSSLYQSQDLTDSQYIKINDIEKEIIDENNNINDAFAYAKFIIKYQSRDLATQAYEKLKAIQDKYGLTNEFRKLYDEYIEALIGIINNNHKSNITIDKASSTGYNILDVSKGLDSNIHIDITALTVAGFKEQINKKLHIPLENIQLLDTNFFPMKDDKEYVIKYLKPNTGNNIIRVNDSRVDNFFNKIYKRRNFESYKDY